MMERYEIGDDHRLAALIDAAARGDEAVITRDGEVVAEIQVTVRAPGAFDSEALRLLHANLPTAICGNGPTIAELRAMDDH
ncbi:hypothetical protein M9979_15850 [Sphingomonas sp. RP10(2022)]|uniref:Uncharacterized protein n=1 Tax=Sphingomonas liriopis TaxID=2949094 RepID=A0A9X2HXZ2_9SPHN|nr:hypothetical protein [Sphingomonas liriopis]MCP3736341.1 hypothetical protein [Sphingomonas liriopis]